MASSSAALKSISLACSLILLALSSARNAEGCYGSIFAFGDSLTDTGNYVRLYRHIFPNSKRFPRYGLPPYGNTFFHSPTGRCSDGRVIVDFIAEYYGLPLVRPYFKGEDEKIGGNLEGGLSFAVIGAPALDVAFYEERGIHYPTSNISMATQLSWFKELLPSLCNSSNSCRDVLASSLFLFGPFGGDDYGHAFFQGKSLEETKSFVPLVINAIGSAIKELIVLGAKNIIVPGLLADGCLPITLTTFMSSDKEDYDPETGCLNWLNAFSQFHNQLLRADLNLIRDRHPHAALFYADYFNAALQLYRSPERYGFGRNPLRACCGARGPYNFNLAAQCGDPPSTACAEPSLFISWDGAHSTEAANRLIARGLLEGPYTIPPISGSCISIAMKAGYLSSSSLAELTSFELIKSS